MGTARTALFNFLFARHMGGQFILRIEDTDRERSQAAFTEDILHGLRWLGLAWDEGPDIGGPVGPYVQSERMARYQEAIGVLLAAHAAVIHDGAVVFRATRAEPVIVHDLIRGPVRFNAEELKDFVIAKPPATGSERILVQDGQWLPLYHLAVVVDDAAMGMTHVIRGEDHLSNTPKHLLLQEALGVPTPRYAHLPLLLDTHRHKLSKRTMATGFREYEDVGYVPEAMLNFLAMLGWRPKGEAELFSQEELVRQFDLSAVQKGGAVFQREKLDWLQRQHVRRMPGETLASRIQPFLKHAQVPHAPRDVLLRALIVWRERGGVLREFPEQLKFIFSPPELERESLPWRGQTPERTEAMLRTSEEIIATLPEDSWVSAPALQTCILAEVDRLGLDRGTILWPFRYAITGRQESPGPGEVAWILGQQETHSRLHAARNLLSPTLA